MNTSVFNLYKTVKPERCHGKVKLFSHCAIKRTLQAKVQAFVVQKRNSVHFANWSKSMVGHLFQNYDTIYVWFFPAYTCNHSCYTIYVRFFVTYTCVLFPSIWPLCCKRAYICAQKSPYICVTNKHVVYGVTESRRIRVTKLYRQQKTPSWTIELKNNASWNHE